MSKSDIIIFWLVAAAGLAAADLATAAPLNYIEADSGDLSPQAPSAFAVDTGTNTLRGVVSFGSQDAEAPNFTGDRDPFVLVVAQGLRIDHLSLTMLPVTGSIFGSGWSVYKDGDFAVTLDNFIQSYTEYSQTWDVSFGPGSYLFSHSSMGGEFNSTWTHDWTFNVSGTATAVPEPSALALSLAGLAGLMGASALRRQRART